MCEGPWCMLSMISPVSQSYSNEKSNPQKKHGFFKRNLNLEGYVNSLMFVF